MTPQDESQAVGDLVLKRKKADERLTLLQAEGKKIGEYLVGLGTQLQNSPAYAVFDQQSIDSRFSSAPVFTRADYPSLDALLKLGDDARRTILEINSCAESLKKFGL
jgi:hypothetical protein